MDAIFTKVMIALFMLTMISCGPPPTIYDTWEEYQGGPDRNQYSTLDQITPDNVKDLKVAWSYALPDSGQMQMNPIMVDDIVYGIGPDLRPFALEGASGQLIWIHGDPLKAWHSTSRGVTYWEDGEDRRIYFSKGPHLYALDASTGDIIEDFAQEGKLDLRTGLPESAQEKFVISNAPGAIYKDLIIMPVRLSEGADAAPGDIRAFDVRTGELAWTFHTIPYPDEEGYDTWDNKEAYLNTNIGAVNNWCGMTLDTTAEILYVPLGSVAPDFYGGDRLGDNLYADCLLALDVNTGKRIWHYQLTKHDIWDRDLPSTPNLIEVEHDGKRIKAISQTTKQGYVYVFDRMTGEPLFDIIEEEVPPSKLIGEGASTTQPIPSKPAPFARRSDELTEDDISPYSENKEELREIFRRADKRFYAPPSTDTVLLLPGYDGGAEWGGAAAHPEEGILYVNSNEMAWLLSMEPLDASAYHGMSQGEMLYLNHCASCHRKDRSGNELSRSPSLLQLDGRYDQTTLKAMIHNGKGMMPGFPHLNQEEQDAISSFVLGDNSDKQEVSSTTTKSSELYRHRGYHKFFDSNGLPALAPPWGTLNAIDLNTGEYIWKVPLGETPELQAQGHPTTGSENYGGPIITDNGLLFIAATKDGVMRAFDRHTGEIIWSYQLPAAAFATPSMYQVDGKQYLVIACGGEKLGTAKGNQIVAFSL